MLIIKNGKIVLERYAQAKPGGITNEAGKPAGDSPQFNYGRLYAGESFYYPPGNGYNWWSMPETKWGPWDCLDEPAVWGDDAIV